ncbi:hypothetical protein [Halogeometricum rufum]|uniref:hypothetical protein n=1 Tax=Halogeometricum rufum TaxID=553469 RepID=UPI0015A5CF2A|nr:hypothetical protein [Halogeometricum rufum]
MPSQRQATTPGTRTADAPTFGTPALGTPTRGTPANRPHDRRSAVARTRRGGGRA